MKRFRIHYTRKNPIMGGKFIAHFDSNAINLKTAQIDAQRWATVESNIRGVIITIDKIIQIAWQINGGIVI